MRVAAVDVAVVFDLRLPQTTGGRKDGGPATCETNCLDFFCNHTGTHKGTCDSQNMSSDGFKPELGLKP